MLEGQAAFRGACGGRGGMTEEQSVPVRLGSLRACPCSAQEPAHSPSVCRTTAAGLPAPKITTRSIQIGVSKWPLGSAELEGGKKRMSVGLSVGKR